MSDKKGRRRRTTIGGQFAPRLIEMISSPAFRILSLSALRILSRIEIELGRHGGCDNGRLPVTFVDLVKHGVDKKSVAPGLRELEALGFIETTERGRPSKADFRFPSKFRLTYLYAGDLAPTQEWRLIKSEEDARSCAEAARLEKDPVLVARSKAAAEKRRQANESKSRGVKSPLGVGVENGPTEPGVKNHPTVLGDNIPHYLYSGRG